MIQVIVSIGMIKIYFAVATDMFVYKVICAQRNNNTDKFLKEFDSFEYLNITRFLL